MGELGGETARDGLPSWAVVSSRREEHIERVVALLERWARRLSLDEAERTRWRRAGWLHDALRDAPAEQLKSLAPEVDGPIDLLHGPAAASRAERDGEADGELLDAVRWHTVGSTAWGALGRALYCADFLEPGRRFARAERDRLAGDFCDRPDAVFRSVVTMRIARSEARGIVASPRTTALLDSLR